MGIYTQLEPSQRKHAGRVPPHCPEALRCLMTACLKERPDDRPTAVQINSELCRMQEQPAFCVSELGSSANGSANEETVTDESTAPGRVNFAPVNQHPRIDADPATLHNQPILQ